MKMVLKPLVIGDLVARLPIIQGGMGVGISLSGLAAAVAREGAIGIISTAQIGYMEKLFEQNPLKANLEAIGKHLAIAKEKAKGGIIGVNIMTASNKYDEYVKCSVENKADLIISGAGLPINLPALVKNSMTKIAPIVSSVKACKVLLGMWEKRYDETADLVVVEGPMAGGHLGFKLDDLKEKMNFDDELKRIIDFVKGYSEKFKKHIPVVFGGGVYDKNDILHYMDLGCEGVQIASRFVVCEECDAHPNFKQAYLDAKEGDIGIISSPVGMPGRAIINDFVKASRSEHKADRKEIGKCYSCLSSCDRKTIPYCITSALINSARGDSENALVFCGENGYRINEMTTVKELLKELTE